MRVGRTPFMGRSLVRKRISGLAETPVDRRPETHEGTRRVALIVLNAFDRPGTPRSRGELVAKKSTKEDRLPGRLFCRRPGADGQASVFNAHAAA